MAKMRANIDGKIKNSIFIFAAYLHEMEDFLTVNPGLSRRITNVLHFIDCTLTELRNHRQSSAYLWNELIPMGF